MTIADLLLEASFRGVSFLVPRESESGGRKVAVHEYPGSNQRFVEDLGQLQPVFNIIAVIHGKDVVNQRNRLTAALNAPGPGVFVHPYLRRRTVIATSYEPSTSDAALGEVVYRIEFTQTEPARGLSGDAGGINAVFNAARGARSSLDTAVNSRYSPLKIADSIKKVGARAREGIGAVQSQVSATVNPVTDALNDVTGQIRLTQAAALSVVRTPQQLTRAFRGVFDSMLALGPSPADLRREWDNLTNFGAVTRFLPNGQRSRTLGTVRTPINRTTRKRTLEDDNLRVLDQYLRIEALINSFEAEADADFDTDEDLTFTRLRLAADFDRIIQNQDDVIASSNLGDEILTDATVTDPSSVVSEALAFAGSLAFDPELRASLDKLRIAAFSVLNEDVKNPFRVRSFDLGVTDIQLATHSLYGSQDLVETLASLNSDQNHGFMRLPAKGVIQ